MNMSNNLTDLRLQNFKKHYLLWVALHHFLTADLVQELSIAVVDAASAGRLDFHELFESELSGGNSVMAMLALKTRPCADNLGKYLQRIVCHLAWQTDGAPVPIGEGVALDERHAMRSLEQALKLAQLDLDSPLELPLADGITAPAFELLRSSIGQLGAMAAQNSLEDISALASAVIASVDFPLSALVVKHLGDLCVDRDHWVAAAYLYEGAENIIRRADEVAWSDFAVSLKSLVVQSQASAALMNNGPEAALRILTPQYQKAPNRLNGDFVLSLNGFRDEFHSRALVEGGSWFPEKLLAVLAPPLLVKSHHLSLAFDYWSSKDYSGASRVFWSVLRRQIALGSGSDIRDTKAHYGRCLVEELHEKIRDARLPSQFWLATRLLIESEDAGLIERASWSEPLISAYVNDECVRKAIEHSQEHSSSILGRSLVVVALFKQWVRELPSDRVTIAESMLSFVASQARDGSSSIFTNRDIGRASLKVLKEVAEARPEFLTPYAVRRFVEATAAKLAGENFYSLWGAIEAVPPYLDFMSPQDMELMLTVILSMLDKLDPKNEAWPIVRPALRILTSPSAKRSSSQNEALGRRVTSTVIRFGLEQRTENANLLFLLQDLEPRLVEECLEVDRLGEVVKEVREHALNKNSSGAITNLAALLIAPNIAGIEGFNDALGSLVDILKSALNDEPAISFYDAYNPLMILADRQERIARDLGLSRQALRERLWPLFESLLKVWQKASSDPLIFSGFAIPKRLAPNGTLVHNWTYASVGFARSMNAEGTMSAGLDEAQLHPLLAGPMRLARVLRRNAYDDVVMDLEGIDAEDRETFYGALGQRLLLLSGVQGDSQRDIATRLIQQCFRVGPHGLDLGAFSMGLQLNLHIDGASSIAVGYRKRLENDKRLRLSLFSMLNAITAPATSGA